MIGIIRCAESREFICMCHPVKVSGINDCSTYCCAMSIHVFCRRMGYDVCAPLKWAAVYRCRECIVHDQRYTMCMCCFCKFFNIQNGQCRVCDGLTKYRSCILLKCCIEFFFCTIWCYECCCNTHFTHGYFNQVESSTVNGRRCHDMASALAYIK